MTKDKLEVKSEKLYTDYMQIPNPPVPIQPTPENPASSLNQEKPEATTPEQKPELAPKPITPEAPRTETFSDQQTTSPTPAPPSIQPEPAAPQTPVQDPKIEEAEQQEVEKKGGIDKAWVDATGAIIEKDKDKPYEEEEDAEKLNITYQQKTFGRKIEPDEK